MPDPVLSLQAMTAAALASALCVLALVWRRQAASPARVNVACILALTAGLLLGYRVLQLRLPWPPVNGLHRLLLIILPGAITIELLAGSARLPQWLSGLLRICLAAVTGRILLHGSVYLNGANGGWTILQTGVVLLCAALLLTAEWRLLIALSQRSCGVSIPLALGISIQATGMTVMLAGYVTGGAAAFPLAAALIGASLATSVVAPRAPLPGLIGSGVVGLFGLLFVGRYFGGLSTGQALVLFLAPLLCWITELPILRGRSPWLIGTLRLVLVAIPLVITLILARQDFITKTLPLMN